MSTKEQATLVCEEVRKALSSFNDYEVSIEEFPDDDEIFIDVIPIELKNCISSVCIEIIIRIVKQHDLRYFLYMKNGNRPCVSIY